MNERIKKNRQEWEANNIAIQKEIDQITYHINEIVELEIAKVETTVVETETVEVVTTKVNTIEVEIFEAETA